MFISIMPNSTRSSMTIKYFFLLSETSFDLLSVSLNRGNVEDKW